MSHDRIPSITLAWLVIWTSCVVAQSPAANSATSFQVPSLWEYSAPLIEPEARQDEPSHAQKDPTVVFFDGNWHVFMTVKLQGRSAIEYCSFADWTDANSARRTLLQVSDSDYFCAPQVFFFEPHQLWYLVYQMGVPGLDKMWVAYSTTHDIARPDSWTPAKPMLDGGPNDPRQVGGLDYWIICDDQRAYLFYTSLNGKMWRLWTTLEEFPHGLRDCQLALEAELFEASHTYRIKGQQQYLTIVEQDGRRYYKAYVADRLDGTWHPIADTADRPFAGWKNVQPAAGVANWTDNISHGELIRDGHDQTLTVDPKQLKFVFQGMLDEHKSGNAYGQFSWRIGMLTPVEEKPYFPPPESSGGWRKLDAPNDIRSIGGMDPAKLDDLRAWLMQSDDRDFAAVVIRNGHIVLEVERGDQMRTNSKRVASVSKAICATVLAIASQQSQDGKTPRRMSFDDAAFEFIPQAQPLSDPRKRDIKVYQLLNHTSGLTPEATGAPNRGPWRHVLGHDGDPHTARLAFDPGTQCGYSTFGLYHASLICENVTGKPYDQFAIEALLQPIGCERWTFEVFEGGGAGYGNHPSHGAGMPARDLARIAYCMLHGGRWEDRQVIPTWFVQQTAQPTHALTSPELRFKINASTFSHGWELPARLTGGAGTPSGEGIPADARYKPGSGGQLIAFVPSLDLVVTRQTGSSGAWEYTEYLRRACAAVISDGTH